MNTIIAKDLELFVKNFPFRENIHNKTILITGATGLIGSTLIRCIHSLNESNHVIALVRNKKKLQEIIGTLSCDIECIESDLLNYDYSKLKEVNYIFHCAAPTASVFFIEHPVETAESIYGITNRILKYTLDLPKIEGIVYLSTLEVYGKLDKEIITEEMQGYWNPIDIRSSYPIAKRAAENLCCLYASEYKIPVMIARLTQTTGAGININDNRIINQFARLAAEKKDIVLHSSGESARPYCYTIDSINALFYILINGKAGEAYNIANKETYISAKDLAFFIQKHFAQNISVRTEINNNMGYAPTSKLNLSTEKLEALGWKPLYSLQDIIHNIISYYKNIK